MCFLSPHKSKSKSKGAWVRPSKTKSYYIDPDTHIRCPPPLLSRHCSSRQRNLIFTNNPRYVSIYPDDYSSDSSSSSSHELSRRRRARLETKADMEAELEWHTYLSSALKNASGGVGASKEIKALKEDLEKVAGWQAAKDKDAELGAAEARGKAAGLLEKEGQIKAEADLDAKLKALIEGTPEVKELRVIKEKRERVENMNREGYGDGYGIELGYPHMNVATGQDHGPADGGAPPIAVYPLQPHYPISPYPYSYPSPYAYAPPPIQAPLLPKFSTPQQHIHQHNVSFTSDAFHLDTKALEKSINSVAKGVESLTIEAQKSRSFGIERERTRMRDKLEFAERRGRGRRMRFDEAGSIDECWDN